MQISRRTHIAFLHRFLELTGVQPAAKRDAEAYRPKDAGAGGIFDGQVIEVRNSDGGDGPTQELMTDPDAARKRIEKLMKGYDPEDCDADEIAEKIAGDPELLAALTRGERKQLVKGLFDGDTGEGEEDAAMKILLEGTSQEDLKHLVKSLGWDELRDELDNGDIDQISKALASKETSAIDELFEELGLGDHHGLPIEDVIAMIGEKIDGMSDAEVDDLIAKIFGEDGNADQLLDAVAQLARTGVSGQQTGSLSDLKALVRKLSERVDGETLSDLTQLENQIVYTERLVENLKNGDYVSLANLLPDLFDPDLSQEQRQALRETLRRFEPEIRAMEALIVERGDVEQRSKLGRFMNARREAIDLYDSADGGLPTTDRLQDFLNGIRGAADSVLEEIADFRTMFAKAVQDVTGLLDDAVGKAFDHVDDDEARELINLLDSKDGREGDAASLLAYLPFDSKVQLIQDIINSGFGDAVLDDDEQAILNVLRETLEKDPTEFFRLINAVGYEELDSAIHGEEWDSFLGLLDQATEAA